jgi:hypothetical protein
MGEKSANSASAYSAQSYGIDTNWYADSVETDHVTNKLDKLVVRDAYTRGDQIYTAGGSGMHIAHIGNSVIHTPCCNLNLNNVLHVPQASKNLASIHHITVDNNVFFELHPIFFFIKYQESKGTLLQCRSKGGIYPLPCSPSSKAFLKQVFNIIKFPVSLWHARLGHPSSSITRFVLSKNCISHSSDVSNNEVCDACL